MPNSNQPLDIRQHEESKPTVPGKRWYGLYPALVKDNADPENMGRVKVLLTWAPDAGGMTGIQKGQVYEGWARVTTLMTGSGYGSWFVPDVNTEVMIAFEGGDPSFPVVVGALWNGQDQPPASNGTSTDNHLKVLRTRSGVQIKFNDTPGIESIVIQTPNNQTIRLGPQEGGSIRIDDGGSNRVTLNSEGITIRAGSMLTIDSSNVEVNAAFVKFNSGTVDFTGMVKCQQLLTDSVVANNYTPGAGNIW